MTTTAMRGVSQLTSREEEEETPSSKEERKEEIKQDKETKTPLSSDD